MEYFCTLAGVGGNSYRKTYCQKMSSAGEWQVGNEGDAQAGLCDYNDCNKYQDFGFGCCDGCCGIAGQKLKCQRVSFAGNPAQCCLLDYICSNPNSGFTPTGGNTGFCFSDGLNQQFTCANGVGTYPDGTPVPNYRDVTSSDCQDVLLQYCTGTLPTDDPNSTAWLDRWTVNGGGRGSCAYALTRNLFNTNPDLCIVPPLGTTGICNLPPPAEINSSGYFWGQELISQTMKRYTEQGFVLGTLPGFQGFNPFQDFLYSNVCCPYPGLCQNGLEVVCSQYNSQRISLNPSVAQWCGCHLPDLEYEAYSVNYNIPPECTPMCNRFGTIPIVGVNADPVICRQSICVMDNVTVNLVNSQIGGGVDFNQICGNCPSGQCSCIVNDSTIDVVNSTINGNLVPINIGCGGSGVCTQLNPGKTGPKYITVPCGTTGATNPYNEYDAAVNNSTAVAAKSSMVTTLIVVGITILFIFLIIWLIHPTAYESAYTAYVPPPPESTQIIPPPPPKLPSRQFIPDTSTYASIQDRSMTVSAPNFIRDTSAYTSGSSSNFIRDTSEFSRYVPESPQNFLRDTSEFRSINDR
jgi:hypothetical protein